MERSSPNYDDTNKYMSNANSVYNSYLINQDSQQKKHEQRDLGYSFGQNCRSNLKNSNYSTKNSTNSLDMHTFGKNDVLCLKHFIKYLVKAAMYERELEVVRQN